MAQIPDLVRDSKFEAHFPGGSTTEVVHTFQESDPASGRRLATRSEQWKREHRIGGGGSGSVWLERCIQDSGIGPASKINKVRAVKQIEINARLGSIDYIRELEAFAKFSHTKYKLFFVESYGWYEGPSQLFIAMEYLERGDLFTYLHSNLPLPEMEVAEVTRQVLEGLDKMHENSFAHRDLKPQNILVKSHPPSEWWVKLADFGITKRIGEAHGQSSTVKGTLRYSAPEIWGFVERGSPYARDIWALGEIMFEMSTKKPVFANPGLLQKYTTNSLKFPTSLLADIGISQAGINFVVSLMHPAPNERMTATSALQRLSTLWMETRSFSTPNYLTTNQSISNSTASQTSTQSSNSVGILTEEIASWTTRAFSKARENENHDGPIHATRSSLVDSVQNTRAVAQGNRFYSDGPEHWNFPDEPPRPAAPKQPRGSHIRRPAVRSFSAVLIDKLNLGPWYSVSEAGYLMQKGIYLFEQNRLKKAEPILQQASKELEELRKTRADLHELALHCLNMIGCCLFHLDRHELAEITLQHAFEIQKEYAGQIKYLTISPREIVEYSLSKIRYSQNKRSLFQHSQFLHMVACCLLNLGRYKDADIILRRAMSVQSSALGSGHELIHVYYRLIRESLYRQGQDKKNEANEAETHPLGGEDEGDDEDEEDEEGFSSGESSGDSSDYKLTADPEDNSYTDLSASKPNRNRLSRFLRPSF